MSSRLGRCFTSLLLLALIGTADVAATAQEPAANSFRFSQPIPVTIRKTNNSILTTLLVGIDEKGITVMSPQGKTIEHANNTFRIVRSPDGSFSYSPSKDNVTDLIQRLNQAQPANSTPNAAGGAPGQPAAGGVPFTVSGAQPQPGGAQPQPAGAHAQPGPAFPFPFGGNNAGANAANNAAAEMARMTAQSQAMAANANQPGSAFPTTPMPTGTHSQTPFTTSPMPTMPMGSHSQMPASTMPTMPNTMPNSQMPTMPGMNTAPRLSMWEYECSKCRHRFTNTGAMLAGHKCPKCGVIWGQVKDQNGRVTSSSPAAKIGGGVGLVVVVIGIIAAIVKKANAA